jgi:acyl-CoA synthetase (AMP-forming)/AMP-acid ligase II
VTVLERQGTAGRGRTSGIPRSHPHRLGVPHGARFIVLADPEGNPFCVVNTGRTHALLVPTMLARVVASLPDGDAGTPTLRSLAYGGARMPLPVLEQALRAFPGRVSSTPTG